MYAIHFNFYQSLLVTCSLFAGPPRLFLHHCYDISLVSEARIPTSSLYTSSLSSLILPGRYLEDESPLANWDSLMSKKIEYMTRECCTFCLTFFFFWLVKTEITDQCMTIRYNNFWKKCNISIIMLPFEFELMCTLFRTVVTAQYFPTNRIRIHILSFYWYVWNSVFDLIWFLRDISYRLRWADLEVVDEIILIVSLELVKGFNIL